MYKLKLSSKYKKFFIVLIFYTSLLCDINYAKEFCISNECTSSTSDLKFKNSRTYSNNLSYIKFLDNIFDGLLANNLESNNERSQKGLEVNITSDQQETSDDGILKANGNVEVETSNSLLLADKLQYDEKIGILKIEGNIRYKRGEQYLEATKIVFNTINNEGFILNAYGSLEMDTITDDLDLNKETKIFIKKEDLLNENKLKDVGLKQSSNISLSGFKFEDKNKDLNDSLMKKLRSYSLSTNFNAFASKWRFQSNKINIVNNNWS